ncbi:MAG: hypothetical protein AAFV29_08860, partial [Myxococcota bacterium]
MSTPTTFAAARGEKAMQYALLIYESAAHRAVRQAGGPEQEKVHAAYVAFTDALVAAGVMRGGEALDLPDFATTLSAGPD